MTTKPTIDLDLAAIEKRAEAATPGPWAWELFAAEFSTTMPQLNGPSGEVCSFGDAEQYYPSEGMAPNMGDMDFIAHARTDIPALLARVRELESRTAALVGAAERAANVIDRTTMLTLDIRNASRDLRAALAFGQGGDGTKEGSGG